MKKRKLCTIIILSVLFSLFVGGFGDRQALAKSSYHAYVTSYTLIIRDRASHHCHVRRVLQMGNQVTVVGRKGSYAQVWYGRTTGYVQANRLSQKRFSSYSAYVTSYTLKVRNHASANFSTRRTLSMTNQVTVTGRGKKYAQIQVGSTVGYVQNCHLSRSKYKAYTGYVTSYTLKMRSSTTSRYSVKHTLRMANGVRVLGKGNKYALVQYGSIVGFVQKKYLSTSAFRSYSEFVSSDTLIVRSQASTHYLTLVKLHKGDQVTVQGMGNKYALVHTGSFTGFVQAKYLQKQAIASLSYDLKTSAPPVKAGSQYGLDISHYQGTVDFNAVKQAGNQFVILKATQGTNDVDSMFQQNALRAKQADLVVDAYHFFTASTTSEGKSEADHFAKVLQTMQQKGITFQYVFVDVERANGLSKNVIKKQMTANVLAFIKELRLKSFTHQGIYSNLDFFDNDMDLSAILKAQPVAPKFLVWLSRYRGQSTYLGPGFPADLWQYTSTGTTSGVSGNSDKDIAYYATSGL